MKTIKAWRENKTSGRTSSASLGYESSTPLHLKIKKKDL